MRKTGWVFFFLMFALVGVGFAADQAASLPGGWDSWKGLVKGLGVGALAGLSVAFLGFMKDKDPNKKWDMKQAASTLVIGAIVGAIAGFEKKDLTKPEDWYHTGTAVLLAELIGKVMFRNGAPVVGNFVQALLGKKNEG